MKACDFIRIVIDTYNESPGKEISIKGKIPEIDFPKLVHCETDETMNDGFERRDRSFEIYECDDMPVCLECYFKTVPYSVDEILSFEAYELESKVATFVLENEIIKHTRYSSIEPLKHPWVFTVDTHHKKQ